MQHTHHIFLLHYICLYCIVLSRLLTVCGKSMILLKTKHPMSRIFHQQLNDHQRTYLYIYTIWKELWNIILVVCSTCVLYIFFKSKRLCLVARFCYIWNHNTLSYIIIIAVIIRVMFLYVPTVLCVLSII